jgi:hypothetical protein
MCDFFNLYRSQSQVHARDRSLINANTMAATGSSPHPRIMKTHCCCVNPTYTIAMVAALTILVSTIRCVNDPTTAEFDFRSIFTYNTTLVSYAKGPFNRSCDIGDVETQYCTSLLHNLSSFGDMCESGVTFPTSIGYNMFWELPPIDVIDKNGFGTLVPMDKEHPFPESLCRLERSKSSRRVADIAIMIGGISTTLFILIVFQATMWEAQPLGSLGALFVL